MFHSNTDFYFMCFIHSKTLIISNVKSRLRSSRFPRQPVMTHSIGPVYPNGNSIIRRFPALAQLWWINLPHRSSATILPWGYFCPCTFSSLIATDLLIDANHPNVIGMSVILKDFTSPSKFPFLSRSWAAAVAKFHHLPLILFRYSIFLPGPPLPRSWSFSLGGSWTKTPSSRWKWGASGSEINQSHRYETAIKSVSEQRKIRNTTCIEKFCLPFPEVLR